MRLLELGQKPASQLALELGIQRNQLYKWQEQIKKTGTDRAFRGPGRKPLNEQSEVERLKRELKKVTEERDILKKAALLCSPCNRMPRPRCRRWSIKFSWQQSGKFQVVPIAWNLIQAGFRERRLLQVADS